jgi:uncharacterized protein
MPFISAPAGGRDGDAPMGWVALAPRTDIRYWRVRGDGVARLSFTDATGDMIGAWVADRDISHQPGNLSYVYVHGIDAALERVVSSGGEVIVAPYAEGALCVATIRDPAGNVIGVWQLGSR